MNRTGATEAVIDEAAVAEAIAAIEVSRCSHRVWLEFYEANPGHSGTCAECRVAGDVAHHQRCIAKYDQVLKVLRAVKERQQ